MVAPEKENADVGLNALIDRFEKLVDVTHDWKLHMEINSY